MPDATVPSDVSSPPAGPPPLEDRRKSPPPDALTGTNLHSTLKTAEANAKALTDVAMPGAMGLVGLAAKLGNVAAVTLIGALFSAAFIWQRADTMAERADYRAQTQRTEQTNEKLRQEDRADRQRIEELFSRTLETISRDNRESVVQMKVVSEQVKASSDQMKQASDQMKLATEAMLRVEKMLTSKQPANP